MGCNQITYQNFSFLGVIHSKKRVSEEKKCLKHYAGNYIYEDDVLQFFNQPEGYVEPDGSGGFDYVYQYKDHLGNIRLSYKDNNGTLEIVEENNYYPFGLKHKGYNNNVSASVNSVAKKFKYNGVELEESLGLNLYEMDFRQYDPALGRFNTIDMLSELSYSMNPYRFAFNNPIYWADPLGLFESRKEARKYRRENENVSGKIEKQKDGTYAIIDRKNSFFYQSGDDSQIEMSDANPNDNVVQFTYASNEKTKDTRPRGIHIYGPPGFGGENGGIRGGVAEGSFDFSDVYPGGGAGKSANLFIRLIQNLNGLAQRIFGLSDRLEPNKSTMENKTIEESKNVPEQIILTLYRNDPKIVRQWGNKAVEFRTKKNDTTVNKSDIQKTMNYNDSINNVLLERALKRSNGW